ncbi:hypothetical protein R1flu_018690 [Riccia fluitans]|uniref:Uncharacterized protein n=1 Tax=Riccia fluitans TaxID=41844 RepID=A0ABD1ZGS8_9MARC
MLALTADAAVAERAAPDVENKEYKASMRDGKRTKAETDVTRTFALNGRASKVQQGKTLGGMWKRPVGTFKHVEAEQNAEILDERRIDKAFAK